MVWLTVQSSLAFALHCRTVHVDRTTARRHTGVVAFRIVACLGLMAATASTAVAQAPHSSDAVIALQREVFGSPPPPYWEFPAMVEAQLALANAYAAGHGIEPDVELACGLTQVASDLAAAINGDKRLAVQARVRRDEICAHVPDKAAAFDFGRCPKFGLNAQTLDLGNGARLKVTRTHWAIEDLVGTHEGNLGLNCNDIVVSMRHLRIDPSVDSRGSVRQFIEWFYWNQSWLQNGTPVRTLGWQLLEFDPASVELLPSAGHQIVEEKGSTWPTPAVPTEYIDGPTLQMLPSGAVRWRFERASKQASGIIDVMWAK